MPEIEEAQEILEALGMPKAQHNPMSGMTLIALCRLAPDASWSEAKREPCTVTKGIMDYLREHYGADYAPNTRETFRQTVLVLTTPLRKPRWKLSGNMERSAGMWP